MAQTGQSKDGLGRVNNPARLESATVSCLLGGEDLTINDDVRFRPRNDHLLGRYRSLHLKLQLPLLGEWRDLSRLGGTKLKERARLRIAARNPCGEPATWF